MLHIRLDAKDSRVDIMTTAEERKYSSTENFSAAVDYLGVKEPLVDREKIGVIGICGSGGFALSAAQSDTRIKAVATASMYVMTDAARPGMNQEQIEATRKQLSELRWSDFENGSPDLHPAFPEEPFDAVPDPEQMLVPGNLAPGFSDPAHSAENCDNKTG